jgi:hypothetical protein
MIPSAAPRPGYQLVAVCQLLLNGLKLRERWALRNKAKLIKFRFSRERES